MLYRTAVKVTAAWWKVIIAYTAGFIANIRHAGCLTKIIGLTSAQLVSRMNVADISMFRQR